MRKLLIVDPTLKSFEGHSYNYDLAIYEAAKGLFDEIVLYTDRAFRAKEGAGLVYRPVLNRLPLDRFRRWANQLFHFLGRRKRSGGPEVATSAHSSIVPSVWSWLVRIAKFLRAQDLRRSLIEIINEHLSGRNGQADAIHLFFQHAHLAELVVTDRLCAAGFIGQHDVHFHLVLRYSPEFIRAGHLSEGELRALLDRLTGCVRPRVHLYTDSDRLSAEFLGAGAKAVATLPVPIVDEPNFASRPSEAQDTTISIGFLGSSRVEKGFCELPRLIEALPRVAGGRQTAALVQVTTDSPDPRIRETIAQLRHLEDQLPVGSLRLLESPVDIETYYGWMAECDIVAMPYLSKKYNASTSGIFVEAICMDIPVLCPGESWMSDEVEAAAKSYGLKIGETFGSLDEIPALVGKLADRMDQYKIDVSRFAQIWRQKHNPAACVSVMANAIMSAAGTQ
jgi:hypothetical protein